MNNSLLRLKCRASVATITVKRLRELIAGWPEYNAEGNESEVWIALDGYFSPVKYVSPINRQFDSNKNPAADLLLETK